MMASLAAVDTIRASSSTRSDDGFLNDGTLQGRRGCSCDLSTTPRFIEIKNLFISIISVPIVIPCTILFSIGRVMHCPSCMNGTTDDFRQQSMHAVGDLFYHLLKVINPNARFNPGSRPIKTDARSLMPNRRLEGRISAYQMLNPIRHLANNYAHDGSCLGNQIIVSRLLHLTGFLGGLVLTVVDVALGVLATPFALLTCGTFQPLNRVALLGWQSIGAIPGDILNFIETMISPQVTNLPGDIVDSD